jgi:hypothetical protein
MDAGVTMFAGVIWTGEQMLIWPELDTNRGRAYRPYWLTVVGAVEIEGVDNSGIVAQAGERHRVVNLDDGWALVQRHGDPPARHVWLRMDARVHLAVP